MKASILSALTFCGVFAIGSILTFMLSIRFISMYEWSYINYVPYAVGLILGFIAGIWTYRFMKYKNGNV